MRSARTLRRWLSLQPFALTAFASLIAISCGGGSDTTSPGQKPVASVQLSPPTNALLVSQVVQLSASVKDADGNALTGRAVQWTSSSNTVATVTSAGLVNGIKAGTATIFATSEGKTGSAQINVSAVPVNALVLSPLTTTIAVGATTQLTALTTDSAGHTLIGRDIAWASSAPTVATVSNTGLVTAVAIGTTNVSATSEGKADTAQITVQTCPSTLSLIAGEAHVLTSSEKTFLCLSAGSSGSEYALVAFNNSSVAASTIPVTLAGTNTVSVLAPLSSLQPPTTSAFGADARLALGRNMEASFRAQERAQIAPLMSRARRSGTLSTRGVVHPFLTGISAAPVVGSIVQLNVGLTGSLCAAKQLHASRVVAVFPHTIVLIDTLAPAGGYTDTQLTAFGQSFDQIGFPLDTLNFGAPSDIDGNDRIAIFFTPGVNAIPGPPGGVIGGLQTSRDLFDVATCAGSNEGEMFYMPVPDPNSTINTNYSSTTGLSKLVLSTLVHEFQHLINAGRRIYVNDASSLEEVWLNEGLSHIAEELLYYRVSGNLPESNIDLPFIQSSQAQLDDANLYQIQNFLRTKSYLTSPEVNSPYSQVDGLAMRGAIWQLLRYSQDRLAGSGRATWYPLVNTTLTGVDNFNAVFGSMATMAHDWSVAQITDNGGVPVLAKYTYPSWNFRSLLPPLSGGSFPLLTHPLVATPLTVSLNGGGSSYLRFRVNANGIATLTGSSSGSALPASVDLTLVRTQ